MHVFIDFIFLYNSDLRCIQNKCIASVFIKYALITFHTFSIEKQSNKGGPDILKFFFLSFTEETSCDVHGLFKVLVCYVFVNAVLQDLFK